ncbi:MAG TPA: NAD(P)H-dependent glycerol-3-phosphate dehydrogenase [Micromonosporaceae bacterium]
MRITVLGAGSWGTTVASVLTRRDHESLVWARGRAAADEINDQHTNERYLPGFKLPARLRASADLEEASRHAQMLVVGVPCAAFRATLEQVRPYLDPWVPIVSLSKGLETATLSRMTQIIKDVLPGHPAAALTGPNLAREIMSGMAAASVIATEDLSVAAAMQHVISRKLLRVYTNHDVIGCEVGGALKNVVAIATGIAQGLGVGDNTRAAVISRGLAELTRLAVAMGAEPATMAGLAGMGDLVATCISPQSRNRHVGEQLGRGRRLDEILAEMGQVAEGVRTVHAAVALADRHGLAMPIARTIHRVVTGQITAEEAYDGLRQAPAGHESEPG